MTNKPLKLVKSFPIPSTLPAKLQWRCWNCTTHLLRPIFSLPSDTKLQYPPRNAVRSFHPAPISLKKTGKANRAQSRDSSPNIEGAAGSTDAGSAYDFSGLESKILKSIERLTHELSQLRAGGRFNPELLESLKVRPDKGSNGTVRLGDIAQVVPKGRVISIIASEENFIKPINTVILESKHNLTPQGPAPDNPTTLTITIPPPTGESRLAAIEQASKAADKAYFEIREARGSHQKKLRAMQVARTVRPDDIQKAQKQMEGVVKRGNEEVKRILDGAKQVLKISDG